MQRFVYFVGTESEVAHHARTTMETSKFQTQIVTAARVLEVAEPGDVAIFYSEHFDRFREAVVGLKDRGVGTIYLIDGILEWRNAWENTDEEPACPFTMRPVLSHKAAVIGDSQARVLRDWGNGGKVELVGVPRFDSLVRQWKSSALETFDHSSSQESDSKKPFRILVMTAKTPGFTPQQLETTRRSLRELKAFFEINPVVAGRQIEVSWRLTGGLADSIGVTNRLDDLTGIELAESLQCADAVISTPSTGMLEAMLMRRPVAALDFHHCPSYVPTAWTINSVEAIEPVVCQLIEPCPRRLHFQNATLADALQTEIPATNRLVDLVEAMFAELAQIQDSKQLLDFSPELLPSIPADPCSANVLRHDLAFQNYEEFSDDLDSIELRAQLAHARREIEHQHRIQQELRDELAEAHSIFEQIQQHPIAGPIVRIRERFISFMKRKSGEPQEV